MIKKLTAFVLSLLLGAAVAAAQGTDGNAGADEFRSLDEDVQALKKEVLDLNRDLFLLEELAGRVVHLDGRRRVLQARFREHQD